MQTNPQGASSSLRKQPHDCRSAVKKFITKENKNRFPPTGHTSKEENSGLWNRYCLAQPCCPFPSLIRTTQHPPAQGMYQGPCLQAGADAPSTGPKLGLSDACPPGIQNQVCRLLQMKTADEQLPGGHTWPNAHQGKKGCLLGQREQRNTGKQRQHFMRRERDRQRQREIEIWEQNL